MEIPNMPQQLTVPAVPEQFPVLRDWLEAYMAGIPMPLPAQQQTLIAAEEIFINIASYAYGNAAGVAEITAFADAAAGMLSVTFSDQGVPFDPLQQKEPDVTLPPNERRLGGLGILFVKKLMDQVMYRRDGSWNRLTIRKRFGEERR